MITNYDAEIKNLKNILRENYDLLHRWQLKLILARTPQELTQYRKRIRQIKRAVSADEEQLALILSEKNNRLMAVNITEQTSQEQINHWRFLGVISILSLLLLFLYNKPNLFLFEKGSSRAPEASLQNIKSKYDWVSPYHDGLAKVRKGHLYGFIDKHGKVVIPIKYDDAWDFRNKRTRVGLHGRFGFINTKGEVIIPLRFDTVHDFNEKGLAHAKIEDKWFYIDMTGECAKNCPPAEKERKKKKSSKKKK